MIYLEVGDITKLENIEAIVSAANGIGVMGAGVAGAIANAGGERLRKDAKFVCNVDGPFLAGDCYKTESGTLKRRGIKWVYHAVTMGMPGGFTSLEIIKKVVNNTFSSAMKDGIKSIAMPAMGTGIGRLDKKLVANEMSKIVERYMSQIDITIIDRDKRFIDFFKESLQTELIEIKYDDKRSIR